LKYTKNKSQGNKFQGENMKPIKRIVFVISVLLIALSCNLFSGTGESSVEDVAPVQEEEVAPSEEDAASTEEVIPIEPPLPTNTLIPPTNTSEPPTDTPEPETISGEEETITIGGFSFHIVEVAYDSTALGMAPSNMGASDQIVWVEFELLSGDQTAFESLEITLTNGSGQSSDAIILASNGMMQMLATVTITGQKANYTPEEQNIAWAFVFPKSVVELYLNFPSGEIVDLTPILP
jgi:hypothetical protein